MTSFHAKALLFDMDGTLLDSMQSAHRGWSEWAGDNGLGDDFSLQGSSHGRQRPDLIRHLLPQLPANEVAAGAERIRLRERDDTFDVVAIPGAAELLRSLPEGTWAIVTSADREVAEARLNAAALPIPRFMVTADDPIAAKPDPAGYTRAAQLLSVAPDECIVFEDSPAGLEAAAGAGMRSVATRWTQADTALQSAVAIVDDLHQVGAEISDGSLIVSVND